MSRLIPRLRQDDHLPERPVDHVLCERPDQSGLLDQRDEARRREQPALGMLPAHERLDAGDTAVGQVDLRLVVQDELAASSAPRTCPSSLRRIGIGALVLGRVDLDPPAVRAGVGEGRVGTLEQHSCDRSACSPDHGDADARLDVSATPSSATGCSSTRLHRLAVRSAPAMPSAAGHSTAYSSPPRRATRVSSRTHRAAAGDLAQHPVAVGGTERVVRLGEAI